MPEILKTTYSSTRCIKDCTKIIWRKTSSLSSQGSLYWRYKQYATCKGLFGTASSEAITFVSEFYAGSILAKKFWKGNDSIIADRRFAIDKELKPLKMKLSIPLFLSDQSQLPKGEATESQKELLSKYTHRKSQNTS